jgi:hypothetical protein
LKVTASGGNLIYFWRTNYVINNVTNNVDLINGGFVSGAGASNLVINPASITNSGSYTVVVSNSIGAATSGVCVVTVKADTFKPTVAITSHRLRIHLLGRRAHHQCQLLDYQLERLASQDRNGAVDRRDRDLDVVELDGQCFAFARLERLRGAKP